MYFLSFYNTYLFVNWRIMNVINTIITYDTWIILIFGLLFNSLLIYLIINKSPKEIGNFRYLLLSITISDTISVIGWACYQGRVYFIDNSFVQIIFAGKFEFIYIILNLFPRSMEYYFSIFALLNYGKHHFVDIIQFAIDVGDVHLSIYINLHRIWVSIDDEKCSQIDWNSYNYFIDCLFLYLFCNVRADRQFSVNLLLFVLQRISFIHSQLILQSLQDDDVYNASAMIYYDVTTNTLFDIYLATIVISNICGGIIMIFCGIKIHKTIQENAMSITAKRMQKKLMKALIIQAVLPG